MGWTNVVADTKITENDIFRLRDALIKFIQNNNDNRHIGLAVWSLGKLRDPSTKSELVKTLERFIDTDLNILFQTMIAIDHIGENIFMNKTSRWLYDKENQVLARAYLQRQK